ncbi:interferon alpha beta receptor 2-like protein [Labeo rohita]|uniref:Interferon alpha beta receptor 2-like protein n=1 Tax=Labeo rohita TaxID=84645 RepID=A0A498LWI7_LABRO|nr:interferon alpha beta receptor 2-like protein [Labeo rohita]
MGPGCPDGVHYTVRVQTLSRSEVVVKECEKVTFPLECNLTEAFSNVEETYFVSVSAALENRTSPRSFCSAFKPIYNTTLEPPLLTVTVCNQSLCVSLRAPTEKLHSVYKSFRFRYRLTVSSEDGSEFDVDIKELKKSVPLEDLAPGRRCHYLCYPVSADVAVSNVHTKICFSLFLSKTKSSSSSGGVSAEQHKPEPDKTRNTDDEQESSATLTWISDSQSQNSESTQMNILEEDYDDDSGDPKHLSGGSLYSRKTCKCSVGLAHHTKSGGFDGCHKQGALAVKPVDET